ncbi:hypothetical protein [Mameliella alba]|nr:hypothetical protein [Mameliella alba]
MAKTNGNQNKSMTERIVKIINLDNFLLATPAGFEPATCPLGGFLAPLISLLKTTSKQEICNPLGG